MGRIDLQGALKVADGRGGVPFPGRQNSQIIPGVWQRPGVAGVQLNRALKTFARFFGFSLLQIDASQPIERLGARGIILQREAEKGFGLVGIASFVENRAK